MRLFHRNQTGVRVGYISEIGYDRFFLRAFNIVRSKHLIKHQSDFTNLSYTNIACVVSVLQRGGL